MSLLGAPKRKLVFNKEEVEFFGATRSLGTGRAGGGRTVLYPHTPGKMVEPTDHPMLPLPGGVARLHFRFRV